MKLVNTHKLILLMLFLFLKMEIASAQVWTLKQCIDTALVHNNNLESGRNSIAIGKEREKEAKAHLLPKVTANADYKYFTDLPYQLMPLSTFNPAAPEGQFNEIQFGVPHNINANLQIALPLYSTDINGAIRNTKLASELSELKYQKSEEEVYYEISNLYYNAKIISHQLNFVKANLKNAEKLLGNLQSLKDEKLATGTDVSKIELQISQLKNQEQNLSYKYGQINNALKFTMGVSLDLNMEIETDIRFEESLQEESGIILDYQIAKTQEQLIQSEISTLNQSRFIPNVNLVGSYGTTGFGYDQSPNEFLKFFPMSFVGLQLSYPIFNKGVTKRKLKQKHFELENNALQQELISEANAMKIENAEMQKDMTKKSLLTTEEQIALAQKIYNESLLQKNEGLVNLTEVLLAENALREAQQANLTAIIDYLKADLELKKLRGNIKNINY
ncbi:TolC family protein [Marivirga harenae]|uniref:TolC family protein n=1 Tax=Marivirga harenae TaxID=2010992 RepID=UPI0026DF8059|nr:TolC family protein [Marivirga harenae]WKV12992.1 TolC family protein [Marivirga harenae]